MVFLPNGLMFFEYAIIVACALMRLMGRISMPLRRHKVAGAGFIIMIKKPTPTKVVTVLAIVWYVLEILVKTIQLLR